MKRAAIIIIAIFGAWLAWLVVGVMICVFPWPQLAGAFSFVALGVGAYSLCCGLLKRRASMWFSGAVTAVLMLAAGIAFGLWKHGL